MSSAVVCRPDDPARRQAEVEALMKVPGTTLTAIAARYGVSRQAVRKWLAYRPHRCPECNEPMREKAPRCGFCIAEQSEAA